MSVVGVDFGYQNCVIATAGRGGVDVVLNGSSNRLNPSMVGFSENRKIGEQAISGEISNLKNTIKGMKRLIGLPFDSPMSTAEMKHFPGVTFVPHAKPGGGPATIAVQVDFAGEKKVLPLELIAGMMMHHMGMIAAEKAADESKSPDAKAFFPQDWVIGIPNYYTDVQRRALLAGCRMVGIPSVHRLMHENTATALAYGIFKDVKKEFIADQPTMVMFIDMGATAFTVSIASFEPGKLKILACHCDPNLGGRDFDLAIGHWVAQKFEEKHSNKLTSKPMETAKTRLKILAASEKAKKTLSPHGVTEASINLEMLQDDLDFHVTLKATEYENISLDLLDRLEAPIKKCLEEVNIDASALSVCEIVGGSTRIGSVKRKIQEILGMTGDKTLSTTMNADESVARGTALQSAILSPRFKVLPYDIQEAQPFPIKISWGDGPSGSDKDTNLVMFDRGVSFPVTRSATFKKTGNFTVKAFYQLPKSVQQYGLDPYFGKIAIVKFAVKPPSDGTEKNFCVNVRQDINGVVDLSSAQIVDEEGEEMKEGGEEENDGDQKQDGEDAEKKHKMTKTNLKFTVSRPLDWTKEEVDMYHGVELDMQNTDRVVKETFDMRNLLESYIYEMRNKISAKAVLGGTENEKATFSRKIDEMEQWLYDEGYNVAKKVYAEKLAELKELGRPMENRDEKGGSMSDDLPRTTGPLNGTRKQVESTQSSNTNQTKPSQTSSAQSMVNNRSKSTNRIRTVDNKQTLQRSASLKNTKQPATAASQPQLSNNVQSNGQPKLDRSGNKGKVPPGPSGGGSNANQYPKSPGNMQRQKLQEVPGHKKAAAPTLAAKSSSRITSAPAATPVPPRAPLNKALVAPKLANSSIKTSVVKPQQQPDRTAPADTPTVKTDPANRSSRASLPVKPQKTQQVNTTASQPVPTNRSSSASLQHQKTQQGSQQVGQSTAPAATSKPPLSGSTDANRIKKDLANPEKSSTRAAIQQSPLRSTRSNSSQQGPFQRPLQQPAQSQSNPVTRTTATASTNSQISKSGSTTAQQSLPRGRATAQQSPSSSRATAPQSSSGDKVTAQQIPMRPSQSKGRPQQAAASSQKQNAQVHKQSSQVVAAPSTAPKGSSTKRAPISAPRPAPNQEAVNNRSKQQPPQRTGTAAATGAEPKI